MTAIRLQAAAPALGNERSRTILVMALAGLAIVLIVVAVDGPFGGKGYADVTLTGDVSGPAPRAGMVAPDFGTVTVDGEAVNLADYAGKPVWLTFGASWCVECRAEAPELQATYERYAGRGLVVLGVFIDEDAQSVRDYANRVGLTFTMVADPTTRIASRYRTLGVPTHFFINPDGVIEEVRLGGLPEAAMAELVEGILQ